MKWKLIDLSLPLEPSLSEPEPVHIEYVSHREGAELLTKGSGIDPNSFPDGLGLSLERIRLTSHSGTHVDAPLHYGPKSEEKKAKSVDQLPLDWFFGQGLVLDCRSSETYPVSLNEIKNALKNQKLRLEKEDILLIHTGADELWGLPEYFTDFRGISLEATEWLIEQKIKVSGGR